MKTIPVREPKNSAAYPYRYESRARLAGLDIFFRPIKTTDAALLQEFFRSHSAETIVHRYFAPLRELSPEQIRRFVDLDYSKDIGIIGLAPYLGRQRMICVGRFFRDASGNRAEIAITVHDDYRRRGIGTFLLQALMRAAREMKIEILTADVMADNHAMMQLLHKGGRWFRVSLEAGIYRIEFSPTNRGN